MLWSILTKSSPALQEIYVVESRKGFVEGKGRRVLFLGG
jgi:hypothetical protein